MSTDVREEPAATPPPRWLAQLLSFRKLAVLSAVHSVLFTGLMVCAFFIGKPQPATFLFGLSHGILYPLMAVACGVAARIKTISVTTALVVIIVGLAGPYFGTLDFLREERRRLKEQTVSAA